MVYALQAFLVNLFI